MMKSSWVWDLGVVCLSSFALGACNDDSTPPGGNTGGDAGEEQGGSAGAHAGGGGSGAGVAGSSAGREETERGRQARAEKLAKAADLSCVMRAGPIH